MLGKPEVGQSQPRVAALSHNRPKLAAAGRSSPRRYAASLAFPATVKVEPFNLCRRCLRRHRQKPSFYYRSYMFIHDLFVSMRLPCLCAGLSLVLW